MLLTLNDNCFSNVSCETVSIIDFARTPYPNKIGKPIWLKLGRKVECGKLFQKPLWLTSLTVCSGV